MNNVLRYKDFIATVRYCDEYETFTGRIKGIDSIVSFEGQSVSELKDAFREAAESYLLLCKKMGINEPLKSYTGIVNLRINSDLHRRADAKAKLMGKTLNTFIKETVEREVGSVHYKVVYY
jgi:predicted HicB family RNase H-like nuclease